MIPVQTSSFANGRQNADCEIKEASRYHSHQKTGWLGSTMRGKTVVLEMTARRWYIFIEIERLRSFEISRDLLTQVAIFDFGLGHSGSFYVSVATR